MFVQIASMMFASALALPQNPNSNPPPQGGRPQPGTQGGTQPGGQPGTAQGEQTRAEQARARLSLQRADKLMGMSIQDKAQGNVGVIDDMILTPTGQISYAVVSGVDTANQSKLYTVPWNSLNMNGANAAGQPGSTPGSTPGSGAGTTASERALINIERERLMAGPSFDRTNWTKTSADRDYFTQVDSYYNGGTARGATSRPVEAGASTGMNSIRGSELRNQAIVDAQGNAVGNISQVVFDPSGSRINYVALTLSNPNSSGPRTIAVPWEALKVGRMANEASAPNNGKAQFMLTTPTDKLTGAPEFQTGDSSWKQMSDPKFVDQMYTYYSVRPYWNDGMNRTDPNMRTPTPGSSPQK